MASLGVACCTTSAEAADLHVGSGQAYGSIQDAVDAANPGDVVVVHAGTYAEEVTLDGSGGPGQPITIEPSPGDGVTLSGRLRMNGDHWIVRGISIDVTSGVDGVTVDGNDNLLEQVELFGGDRDGVDGGGVGNQVRDCSIHDFDAGASDAHCIVLNPGAQDWTISGNELYDCSGDAIQLFSQSATRDIVNIEISGNHMYFTGALSRTENAIDVKDVDGLVVYGNLMHGFPDNKVVVFQKGPANVDMQCNVMADGFTGVEFRAEDGGVVENILFARNVMHDFSSYALKFDGTTNADVHNNTFVDIGSDGLRIEGAGLDGGAVHNNAWLRTGSIDPGNFDASHNAFFDTGSIGIASANDVSGDPLLDADYHPSAGSPLVDAGLDVGLMFAGAAPDIGWQESGLDWCAGAAPGGTGGGGGSATGGGGARGGAGNGTGGSGADGSGAGSSSGGSSASDPESDDGCGCRTAGSDRRSAGWILVGLLGLAAVSRRSRRPAR